MDALTKRFATERNNPAFLRSYIDRLEQVDQPVNDALDAYLATLPDSVLSSPDTFTYVAQHIGSANTRAFEFLLTHRPALNLSKAFDPQQPYMLFVEATVRATRNDYRQAVQLKSDSLLERHVVNTERSGYSGYMATQKTISPQMDSIRRTTANQTRLRFYRETKQFGKYKRVAVEVAETTLMNQPTIGIRFRDSVMIQRTKGFMKLMPDSLTRGLGKAYSQRPALTRPVSWGLGYALNELTQTYLKLASQPADFAQALIWSDRAVLFDPNFNNLSTNTLLLHKLKRKAEAIKRREQALDATHREQYRNGLAEKALDVVLH